VLYLLTVFFAAILARLGWALGGLLIEQFDHQVDRFFSWIHRHEVRDPKDDRYIELAHQIFDTEPAGLSEYERLKKRREG